MANHEIKFRGPVDLNPEIVKLQEPKMWLLESILNQETGQGRMSAMILSAVKEGQEKKIGHIVFADINTIARSAVLNFNMILRSDLDNGIPVDFKNLFEPDFFSNQWNAIFVNSEDRGIGIGNILFRCGVLHVADFGIKNVVIYSKPESRGFYEKQGAINNAAVPIRNLLTLETQAIVAQHKGYLDTVVKM